jgi:hypothetical protein
MEQELGIPSDATIAAEKAAYEGGFKGQPSDAFAPKGKEGKGGKGRKSTLSKASEVGKAGEGGNHDEHGNVGEARLAKDDGRMATLAKQATMAKAKHGNVGKGSKDGETSEVGEVCKDVHGRVIQVGDQVLVGEVDPDEDIFDALLYNDDDPAPDVIQTSVARAATATNKFVPSSPTEERPPLPTFDSMFQQVTYHHEQPPPPPGPAPQEQGQGSRQMFCLCNQSYELGFTSCLRAFKAGLNDNAKKRPYVILPDFVQPRDFHISGLEVSSLGLGPRAKSLGPWTMQRHHEHEP